MTSNSAVYIFIPGIMGSSLRYRGIGVCGELVDEEIWGSNVSDIERLLGLNPQYLTAANVEPGEIIKQFELGFYRKKDLYGTLLSYLTNPQPSGLGLVQGENFFPFPYDWRADNELTAELLARFIRQILSNTDTKIRIIAHSMGGIVARLTLLKASDIAQRTDKVFQIASPIQGSTKAYYSLKKGPRFHWLLDKVWGFFHTLKPERRHQLLLALQQCYSLYQMLPPEDVQVLRNSLGARFSAVDHCVWDKIFANHVNRAKEVHTLLRTKLPQKIKYIYSTCHETEADYIVDHFFNHQAVLEPQGYGDGTVIASSAIALSDVADRVLINEEPTTHDGLCQNSSVLHALRTHMLN